MTMAIVNDLATRFRCDRVSLGLRQGAGNVRLSAISHSATFKNQSRVADAIENAMEEAIDQGTSVAHPPIARTERAVTMAHRALAEVVRLPGAALLSVAFADSEGKPLGALTFERHARADRGKEAAFDEEELQLAETIAALLGPTIGLQMRANRLISGRAADKAASYVTALLGTGRPALKLGALCAAALVLVLAMATAEYRVTAKSVVEAEVQRAAVAPFEGFIRAARVRAGDAVKSGDVLVELDDRELILDRSKWRSEHDKLQQKQREALAKHERTDLVVSESQIRQAEAQLTLAEEKLARARILAPFDGIVVAGDLSQLLGSPIEKGKTLFVIAPLNAYRLIVYVDERDMRFIATGQKGTVALAGMPWSPVSLVVSKITPVATTEDDRNVFRVEAQLLESGPQLRPGMEGVARIETGPRHTLWIWTHTLLEWLRLAAWKHLP
jgi:multidrug resistance efflux pump